MKQAFQLKGMHVELESKRNVLQTWQENTYVQMLYIHIHTTEYVYIYLYVYETIIDWPIPVKSSMASEGGVSPWAPKGVTSVLFSTALYMKSNLGRKGTATCFESSSFAKPYKFRSSG